MQTFNQCAYQRGTVMVYILVAIGLFSALTYAISSGNRTNSSAITEQQAKLAAQEIIEFGNSVATAAQKIKLRGFADTEISFENDIYLDMSEALIHESTDYPNCATDACKVFDINGGSIEPLLLADTSVSDLSDQAATAFHQPGHPYFSSISVVGVGSTANDLVLRLPFLKRSVCLTINELLNVDNPSGEPPKDGHAGWAQYNNNFGGTGVLGDEVSGLSGKTAFCAVWPSGSLGESRENHFYQVLIAR